MFLHLNLLFSFINAIFLITRFVELHKKMEHMVFHCVGYKKHFACVPKRLLYSTRTLISSQAWREASIRSLASSLSIKSELS